MMHLKAHSRALQSQHPAAQEWGGFLGFGEDLAATSHKGRFIQSKRPISERLAIEFFQIAPPSIRWKVGA